MAASPRSGTGYVNFDSYLGANKGAIDRTRAAMTDPLKRRMAGADMDRAGGMEDLERGVGANDLKFDPSLSETDMLARGGATYGGPNSAMDDDNFNIGFGNAQAANKDAQRQANLYGRAGALRDAFGAGRPTYSAGNQMFDSALLGMGAGRGAYDANAKAGTHLLDKFSKDMTSIGGKIGEAKTGTAEAAAQYAATGGKMRDDRVKREADAAQSQKEAEAYQQSPWGKWLHPKTKDPRFAFGNFNAGVGGGNPYSGP